MNTLAKTTLGLITCFVLTSAAGQAATDSWTGATNDWSLASAPGTGDLALEGSSEEALIAGDITDHLGRAFSILKSAPGFGKAKKKIQF